MLRHLLFLVLILAAGLPSGWTSACESGGVEVETSSRSVIELSRAFGPGFEFVDEESELSFQAINRNHLPGELVIEATLLSAEGVAQLMEVATATLQGGSQAAVAVPVSRFDLPRLPQGSQGLLVLSGSVRFADGTVERVSHHLDLVFSSESGGWLIFDENTSLINFQAAGLTMGDEVVGNPAFSRKVSEKPNWRPPEDDVFLPTLPKRSSERAAVKICIQQMSVFSDAGIGEDFWTSSASTARASRGAWVAIMREGNYLWVDFLGDGRGADDPGSGCTGLLAEAPSPSGTYDYSIQIWTVGNVQGNAINTAYNGNPV
ncbi:MAG: hypothetical protein ABFS37_05470, partial [Acidobacteriota bacterium]